MNSYNYPSPCDKCKLKKCRGKQCDDWLAYYRTHQKWINGYAKKIGLIKEDKGCRNEV